MRAGSSVNDIMGGLFGVIGILGALLGVTIRGLPNDVYFKVGLITIIGLAAKDAILIIEFAKQYYESGTHLVEAIMHAVRDRLRPIVMTSLAFGFGVLAMRGAELQGGVAVIAVWRSRQLTHAHSHTSSGSGRGSTSSPIVAR